jgi:hypothetical protein
MFVFMKKFYILLIITALANITFAQMKPKEVEAIKNDTTLFYGLSNVCNSSDEATEGAKIELYENIAKNCNSSAIYIAGNGDKQLENIVRTFKEPLDEKSTERAVIEDDDDERYQYIIYIKRSDFRTMCNDRRDDIQRYISKAVKMEYEACCEDALKSYYWALMLCYAHPQGKKLRFHGDSETVDYEWIAEKISGNDGILRSFNFIVPKENGVEEDGEGLTVKLRVKNTAGQDVVNLRCECHDGRKFMPNTVRDGKLIVQLHDKNIKSFKIKVNYDFKEDAKKMNVAVSNAIELIKVPRFSNNIYTVDLEKTMNVKKEEEVDGWKRVERNRAVDENVYLSKMAVIEKALRERNIAEARECFSVEGYNMLDTLSRYGKMTVVGKPNYKFLNYKDEVLCRSITIQFDFRNTPGFSQDVVFRFDTINKVVTSLAFRLSDQAEYDIISKTKWPEESRLILVNFLEDYQTAYALKRHRYLESIYSDDALIIVGRLVKKTEIPDRLTLKLTAEEAELTKYDKDTYMKNLSMCFKNNEYIRLRFTETDFTKANNTKDVYGVRVRQEYFSSSYGDVGYLFLLVDLRGAMPLIHVRAWQPDKVDLEKLMNMSDVRFN